MTELVQSERVLRASEGRFRHRVLFEPLANAITTLAEGRYVELNDAFERQMGYTRGEVVGRTSLELNVWPTPAHRSRHDGGVTAPEKPFAIKTLNSGRSRAA